MSPTTDDRPVKISEDVLDRAATVIKLLGHPLRLRILEALESGEKTVSQLQEYAEVGQAAVSQQLGLLRSHGVVGGRREGSHVYYRILEPKVQHILDCIRTCDFRASP